MYQMPDVPAWGSRSANAEARSAELPTLQSSLVKCLILAQDFALHLQVLETCSKKEFLAGSSSHWQSPKSGIATASPS